MVPRDDDRPTLLARVDPMRCVSCGICAGSCAPMGIGPPGRSGRDQLAAVRSSIELAGAVDIPIVAICCAEPSESHAMALRAAGAFVHPVPCVGSLHTSVIELFLRSGAAGVIVFGCPPRDCINREGPKWLIERVFNDREAELQTRVDRRRVRLATLAPGEVEESIAALESFARDLAILDRPHRDADTGDELVCDAIGSSGSVQ